MTDHDSPSADESDSVGELQDDGQLTIRIPNPKHYMARQSQWKGRRGKPRCDHCRMNNLKCDRVLPACNHCSWASGRNCKYTPLPTPAHRGIPRCDRCRLKNLKCDRNLPVCNHCSGTDDAECNYTPKKRHKVPSDHGPVRDRQILSYGNRSASFLVSDMSIPDDQTANGESSEGHSFYGQNVASSSPFAASPSPPFDGERSSDFDDSRYTTSALNPPQPTKSLSFISHSFPGDQGILISRSNVDPWTHPAFAPLPDIVLHRLGTVNCVEMPNRHSFDESLSAFLAQLMPEIRETATFVPEIYAKICRYIARGDTSKLPERLRIWSSFHHVRSGSDKCNLLLKPRDAYFTVGPIEEEKLRREYVMRVDGKVIISSEEYRRSHAYDKDSAEHGLDPLEWTTAFERLPVQPQIYDVLVYAHRAHGTASSMLFEVRRLGVASITWPMVDIFVRQCPLCNLRGKQANSHHIKPETLAAFESVMKR